MIRRIEVRNYKLLRYVDQSLSHFHVLIGPNASGKTTFMDVMNFMSDIVNKGIDEAIMTRASNYSDLTFSSQGGDIELALEIQLPENIKNLLEKQFDVIRYEMRIGLSEETEEHNIKDERVLLLNTLLVEDAQAPSYKQPTLFVNLEIEKSILAKKYPGKSGDSYKLVIRKKADGNDNFYNEIAPDRGWIPSFKLGPKRSALANLPADETKFPAATWLKKFLETGIQLYVLDSLKIRQASPPGMSRSFQPDGSNLPWVIHDLKEKNPSRFKHWIAHLQTALPDILDIDSIEREDDKHRYLKVHYSNGISVPGWLVSDGTLRLLALTLPAYLDDFHGVYLVEEPENGLHPRAVETAFQSLSSVYHSQIMLASHSPVILSLVRKEDVLCFTKEAAGEARVVKGSEHPALKNWKGKTNLGVLFASAL